MATEKRLIDVNELSEHKFPTIDSLYDSGWNDAIDAITENAPTVDAVEVVRCKDCKWRQQDEVNRNFCGLGDFYCGDTDFCSRGERKDNEREKQV